MKEKRNTCKENFLWWNNKVKLEENLEEKQSCFSNLNDVSEILSTIILEIYTNKRINGSFYLNKILLIICIDEKCNSYIKVDVT